MGNNTFHLEVEPTAAGVASTVIMLRSVLDGLLRVSSVRCYDLDICCTESVAAEEMDDTLKELEAHIANHGCNDLTAAEVDALEERLGNSRLA